MTDETTIPTLATQKQVLTALRDAGRKGLSYTQITKAVGFSTLAEIRPLMAWVREQEQIENFGGSYKTQGRWRLREQS